jgi:hypothetical protein
MLFVFNNRANSTYYESGNSLLSECDMASGLLGQCLGYLEGIADIMERQPINGYRACIPVGVQLGQLRDIAVQFLTLHAGQRHFEASGLIAAAYESAFPCH